MLLECMSRLSRALDLATTATPMETDMDITPDRLQDTPVWDPCLRILLATFLVRPRDIPPWVLLMELLLLLICVRKCAQRCDRTCTLEILTMYMDSETATTLSLSDLSDLSALSDLSDLSGSLITLSLNGSPVTAPSLKDETAGSNCPSLWTTIRVTTITIPWHTLIFLERSLLNVRWAG